MVVVVVGDRPPAYVSAPLFLSLTIIYGAGRGVECKEAEGERCKVIRCMYGAGETFMERTCPRNILEFSLQLAAVWGELHVCIMPRGGE
jgi:hypothetical protein